MKRDVQELHYRVLKRMVKDVHSDLLMVSSYIEGMPNAPKDVHEDILEALTRVEIALEELEKVIKERR